jgi:putative nucleotidyltransferase with HDIG domain
MTGEDAGTVERLQRQVRALRQQLGALRAREAQHQAAEQQLREALAEASAMLQQSVHALAIMVEIRDPFTLGHQRRVSSLAAAIAEEMGLPEAQVEVTRLAGAVHDIGKACVPLEVLTKPGRLTETESRTVREHPQRGYDALRLAGLRAPIADIVRQHHERANGSGYPQGLRGEEILIEARILGVVDVFEAMSSPRPYRIYSGAASARQEIARHRGVLYDSMVVDACLATVEKRPDVMGAIA